MRGLRPVILAGLLVLLAPGGCGPDQPAAPATLVDVPTPDFPGSLPPDPTRDLEFQFMLDSYQPQGPLHTLLLCGDFQQLMDIQHWGILMELDRREATRPPHHHGCSMFQCRSGNSALLGRNFDHKFSEMLVAWCYPDSGYTSLGFIPLNQWGFTRENPFDAENPQHRRMLLMGPTATIEGMNSRGVTVTLASLGRQKVTLKPDRKPRFLIHLVREILDHAANLEEAIAIAQRYNIFDNGRDLISHHIFLADPESGSAVLEWQNGVMEVIRSGPHDQVVTNRPLFARSDNALRSSCRRYRTLAEALDRSTPGFAWQDALDALRQAAQHNATFIIEGERWRVSTQWSAVFDMTARQAYIAWGRDYKTVYRFTVPVAPLSHTH